MTETIVLIYSNVTVNIQTKYLEGMGQICDVLNSKPFSIKENANFENLSLILINLA